MKSERKAKQIFKDLRVGEELSFDGGRLVVRLKKKSGQVAHLCLMLHSDVLLDKQHSYKHLTPLALRE